MLVRRAVYAGSFDPVTNGHLWVIAQGVKMFDELYVAIGENPEKKYTFSLVERLDMLKSSISLPPVRATSAVTVEHFTNQFLVDYAKEKHASFILRGLRNGQDFEYEKAIRHINSDIEFGDPTITTVFVVPPRELSEISSSFVKALCGPEGWKTLVSKMVSEPVMQKLIAIKG